MANKRSSVEKVGMPAGSARRLPPLSNVIRFDRPQHHLDLVTPLNLQGLARDHHNPLQGLALRRVKDWYGQSFAWAVRVSVSVSPKAVVRNHVARRLKAAVREDLASRGWGVNGEVLSSADTMKKPLQGALLITADKTLVVAEYDDVKRRVAAVVDRIVARQTKGVAEWRFDNRRGIEGQPLRQPRKDEDARPRDNIFVHKTITGHTGASDRGKYPRGKGASGRSFRKLALFDQK